MQTIHQKINALLVGIVLAALLLWSTPALVHAETEHADKNHVCADHPEHEMHTNADGHEDHEDEPDEAAHAGCTHGNDGEDAHDEHAHETLVELDPESKRLIGLTTARAQHGTLDKLIRLTGKISLNQDRMAHLVPYVAGVVQSVHKTLGDTVHAGEVMAVLHSRELSEARAAYLASIRRYELAATVFEREKNLRDQNIASEQEFQQARLDFSDAGINKMLAEQKLLALGFDRTALETLASEPAATLMRYEITAPFAGVIIDKHITLGELVKEDAPVFIIADLQTVWVDLDVFAKDLPFVEKGQTCRISLENQTLDGRIDFISPVLDPRTRTATARVILDNPDGRLRPGLFVTANLFEDVSTGRLIVPRAAVQTVNGEPCVFVPEARGYALRPVTPGHSSAEYVEILAGLQEDEQVVTKGAFDLKAKIVTGTLDSHAGHGH